MKWIENQGKVGLVIFFANQQTLYTRALLGHCQYWSWWSWWWWWRWWRLVEGGLYWLPMQRALFAQGIIISPEMKSDNGNSGFCYFSEHFSKWVTMSLLKLQMTSHPTPQNALDNVPHSTQKFHYYVLLVYSFLLLAYWYLDTVQVTSNTFRRWETVLNRT